MPKAFSVASWNVEHFKDDPTRIGRVIQFLVAQKPDVFALYEVEGKNVFSELTQRLPGYTFHITEGEQVQEILIGVKGNLTAFFTQKIEFKSGTTSMRPGALLTLTVASKNYSLLFLHLSSGPDPRGWGLRDDMLERALDFRLTLDKAAGGQANYIFLGDLNTMGLDYSYKKFGMDAAFEIEKLDAMAAKAKYQMRRLTKTAPNTWSNGSGSKIPPSALDHAVASNHLKFKQFSNADISVRGWPALPTTAEQDKWIADYSDHGLLYFEVQRV